MWLLQTLRRRQRHQVRVLLLAPKLLQEDDRQPGMQIGQEQFPGRQIFRPESGAMQGFLSRDCRMSLLLVPI